jgi:Protein of unknwon function (DUF3310)
VSTDLCPECNHSATYHSSNLANPDGRCQRLVDPATICGCKLSANNIAARCQERPNITTEHKAGDEVDHPTHYNSHPSGIEAITIVRHHSFNVGNALKYLWRQGLKQGEPSLKDLKKAAWYLNDEIQKLEREGAK